MIGICHILGYVTTGCAGLALMIPWARRFLSVLGLATPPGAQAPWSPIKQPGVVPIAQMRAVDPENLRNCYRHAANASSRFLGVSWHKANGKWTAQIGVNGKKVYLGIHATEMAAAQAREAYIAARPELMARSNFQNPERTQSP